MSKNESICRKCFHSYVCEQFNEHREWDNKKCHFANDHFISADLINRLQAENERLEKENQLLLDNHPSQTHRNCVVINNGLIYTKTIEDYEKWLTDVSTEAYKEFAERLKENAYLESGITGFRDMVVDVRDIDDVLDELTNEQPPNDVKCIDCEYLEINGAWGVCAEAYKMVHPDDCCGKGKLKERVGDER